MRAMGECGIYSFNDHDHSGVSICSHSSPQSQLGWRTLFVMRRRYLVRRVLFQLVWAKDTSMRDFCRKCAFQMHRGPCLRCSYIQLYARCRSLPCIMAPSAANSQRQTANPRLTVRSTGSPDHPPA